MSFCLVELVSGGERSAEAYGFGAEEGYEGEDETFNTGGDAASASDTPEDF